MVIKIIDQITGRKRIYNNAPYPRYLHTPKSQTMKRLDMVRHREYAAGRELKARIAEEKELRQR